MLGKGTICEMVMPVASPPSVAMVAADPMMDSAYSCRPLRSRRIALMNSMVGLPASPTITASGSAAATLLAAAPASDAEFSTVAITEASSL